VKLLAIPQSNQKTIAKWLVISGSLPHESPLSNSLPQEGERTNVKSNLQFWGESDRVSLRDEHIK